MKPLSRHTQEQREFIVRRLAAFETPRDIAAIFQARFPDTACSEQDVLATDPRVNLVPPDLWQLFYAERRRVLTDDSLAPFIDQRARLYALSRQAERYETNNQHAEARAVFRQIAEELGVLAAGKATAKGGKDETVPEIKRVEVRRTIVDPVAPANAEA